jgi:hypothetical protein
MNSDGWMETKEMVIHDHGSAAHLTWREEGKPDHHHQRGQQEQGVAFDEMETVEADAFGNGGRSREGQHETGADEKHENRQKKPVDRPEPLRQWSPLRSAYHTQIPRFSS